jgi:hypothetical protein
MYIVYVKLLTLLFYMIIHTYVNLERNVHAIHIFLIISNINQRNKDILRYLFIFYSISKI